MARTKDKVKVEMVVAVGEMAVAIHIHPILSTDLCLRGKVEDIVVEVLEATPRKAQYQDSINMAMDTWGRMDTEVQVQVQVDFLP